MNFPTQAIILAAGFGTRMLPLSLDTPKPMMPFWGEPILERLLALLARWGVRDALVNIHHQPDSILRHVRRRRRDRLRVCLSFEPEILGTGGALRRVEWFIGKAPFWIVNADIVAGVEPALLVKALAARRALAALWLHPDKGPRTVEMNDGLIEKFLSSRPGTAGTYTFCGLHLATPAIRDYLPAQGFSSIIQVYDRARADGRRIAGVCDPHAFWADIGTPAGYLEAHREALARRRRAGGPLVPAGMLQRMRGLVRRGVRVRGFAAVGEDVILGRGAAVSDSVIWDHARVAGDAILDHAIVGTAAQVRGRVARIAVRSDFALAAGAAASDPQLAVALARLGWEPQATTAIPFEARGSARVFTRLTHQGRSAILIRYSLERQENALYAAHARFLKRLGWPVPAILHDLPERRMLIVEDLGDRSLQRLAGRIPRRRLKTHYQQALLALHRLHELGAAAARRQALELVAPFSADVYRWEREFFARQFLQPRLAVPPGALGSILRELASVADRLLRAPAVLVHRDLQSSNILIAGGRPYFIDFQGMRLGAAAYDLASLLCDPYVELPADWQRDLLAYYNATRTRGAPVSERLFWLAAVERLAQALGAYGRLGAQADTAWFEGYIPPALRMMRRALRRTESCPRLRTLIEDALDKPAPAPENASKH